MLREDQYEELLALYSYINWLQMVYGPITDGVFNIFRASRSHFDWFISDVYDVSNPIIYSEDGELLNQRYSIDTRRLLRLRFGYEEDIPNVYYNTVNPNSDYPTPTAYDNKMWHCNYFRNTLGVMGNYFSSNHDLYWNEIDWPSRNNDNNNHYITRVLSQPRRNIIKYRSNGLCRDGKCAATKIQHVWRGYILRLHFTRLHDNVNIIQRVWKGSHARGKLTTAERILINTGGDKDHVDLHRGLRMKKKGIRRSVSQRVTGSRRRYAEALVIALPSAIVIQRYVRRFFAIKLVSKLKESVCCDPPINDNAPSHTPGLSQSSMPTKKLLPEVVSMNDGENGETLDGSSGLVDILQDTTMYTALKDIPTWGGRMNQSYTGYTKSDPNKKNEEEWGSLLDWPVHYDDIQEDTVKDWQWIDLMTRKFASRGKFAGREVMPYDSLLIVMLLASSITTLKSLVLSSGNFGTLCFIGLKEIPLHAHQWGDNTNCVCRDTYGNDHGEWGEWRAIGNNDDTIRLLVKDTVLSYSKWMRWSNLWKGKEKNKLVVLLYDSFVGLHSNCAHFYTPIPYHWISSYLSIITIGSTFSIGETSTRASDINHSVHVIVPVDGKHNNVYGGNCYIDGRNKMIWNTSGIVSIGDARQRYRVINDVYKSSDNSYDHDTNDARAKSGNNVPDPTQQCTSISSTVYQDDTHCSIIQSDMTQDIILNLKSDNNDFDLSRRTSNDTMEPDIQQCDNKHGTTGAIGINTVGILGNGDDQAITARDGERISSSCVMIKTEDKLVYDYNNSACIRIKSFIGNVLYIYNTNGSTFSQHTTRTTPVKYITIMSIIGRKDVNSTTHVTLHQNLNLDGIHIRRHHTGDDNNGLYNVMYTIIEVNNESISTSDDNVDAIKPSTTSTSKEKEIMNGEVEIDYLHPEASTLATRSTDMRVNDGEGYTSVTINRMNPSDLCILYAVITRSNILWELTLVIKRKSLTLSFLEATRLGVEGAAPSTANFPPQRLT